MGSGAVDGTGVRCEDGCTPSSGQGVMTTAIWSCEDLQCTHPLTVRLSCVSASSLPIRDHLPLPLLRGLGNLRGGTQL